MRLTNKTDTRPTAEMTDELANCVRNCLRGVAAQNGSSPTRKAAEGLVRLISQIQKHPGQAVDFAELFQKAVAKIRIVERQEFAIRSNSDKYDDSIETAARAGMRFIAEKSCADPAAKGRAGKCRSQFIAAVTEINHA
jgi:hypothetical protein